MVPIPSIPDKVYNFQVFQDKQQIKDFMSSSGIFASQIIEEDSADSDEDVFQVQDEDLVDGVVQLKTNKIPKGIVSLERLFDQDTIQHRMKDNIQVEEAKKVNIGIEADPRNILIGKSCVGEERERIITVM